ncbi:YbaB/EbfC family nucleoid-associated protein [Rhodococcus sp. IEGM 1401]|uniref:YbaB/EbfC family nucleoid-associated protein n=1 Tax=unclassified Rhodococcus (in: high G+C Gram-positive bacteria) TaxID=192944 RepID=UPI0022B4B309|nr:MULTISPECIES: YbaB/EbfC family nucleoid-associated protein [unclassified Rhodococcus (in: high G+C Gram-positive bacteria)]MCZ4559248.1 YbaB/EbfC family nucleoid-associated protein [Rhodococcus sp. IEGM 1401]MDI9919799.1 YbaB/EbfC family nucleoid-associated protein [Rhodococcus sp. IEGM 1372]MDV8031827.1 YbaB/EbfC family nucleoid-associated protein [Rhodococcus sp. IEGM 1414]
MTHAHTTELDALVGSALHRLDALRETHERLDRIRIRLTSPDYLVTVVVDGSGAVVELELAENLGSVAAHALASTITVVAADAARAALDQREVILQSLQGSFTDS